MTFEELQRRLRERRCKPSVVARVLKLNPNGVPKGSMPRGIHRRWSIWTEYLVGPRQFVREQGRDAYYAMDQRWWIRRGHRKVMDRAMYLDNIWKFEFTDKPLPHNEIKRIVP